MVSTKISDKDFNLLQRVARDLYITNQLPMPSTSDAVRFIMNEWFELRGFKVKDIDEMKHSQPSTFSTKSTPEGTRISRIIMNELRKPIDLPGLKSSDKKEKVANEKVGKDG